MPLFWVLMALLFVLLRRTMLPSFSKQNDFFLHHAPTRCLLKKMRPKKNIEREFGYRRWVPWWSKMHPSFLYMAHSRRKFKAGRCSWFPKFTSLRYDAAAVPWPHFESDLIKCVKTFDLIFKLSWASWLCKNAKKDCLLPLLVQLFWAPIPLAYRVCIINITPALQTPLNPGR